MKKIAKTIARISELLDRAAGFCCFSMMVLVACNVIGRKVFNVPVTGTIELVQILFALTAGLALANCAVKGGHITIDFVAEYVPEWFQKLARLITITITIVTVAVSGWMLVGYADTLRETGRYTGSLKIAYYPFVYMIAIGFLIFALVEIVKIFVPDLQEEVR